MVRRTSTIGRRASRSMSMPRLRTCRASRSASSGGIGGTRRRASMRERLRVEEHRLRPAGGAASGSGPARAGSRQAARGAEAPPRSQIQLGRSSTLKRNAGSRRSTAGPCVTSDAAGGRHGRRGAVRGDRLRPRDLGKRTRLEPEEIVVPGEAGGESHEHKRHERDIAHVTPRRRRRWWRRRRWERAAVEAGDFPRPAPTSRRRCRRTASCCSPDLQNTGRRRERSRSRSPRSTPRSPSARGVGSRRWPRTCRRGSPRPGAPRRGPRCPAAAASAGAAFALMPSAREAIEELAQDAVVVFVL